ncbi:MAG: molybdenum cofactor guanylyltransferase [Propionibacteriaceae bacterium]|nr:molybdenum cofactor guanylyltransferase [Propionibacteriaceae bacterium]
MANLTHAHIILAGGRSRRLRTADKSQLIFRGQTLLEHAVAAGGAACHQVAVGPLDLPIPGVRVVREDPPFGGPVAGIAAGAKELVRTGCDAEWVLITACDHPYAEAAARALVESVSASLSADSPSGSVDKDADLITPTDSGGHDQILFALYRRAALSDALAAHGGGHDLSVRALIAGLRPTSITLPDGLLGDIDDAAAARRHGIEVPDDPRRPGESRESGQ